MGAKDIGTGFEYKVRDLLNEMLDGRGFKATRIWYSGAGLRKPYDLELRQGRKIVLTIEAKRSIYGSSISFQKDWLKQIENKHIVVFAIGNFRGKKSVPVYAICRAEKDSAHDLCIVAKPHTKSVAISQKTLCATPFALESDGVKYLVVDFRIYIDSTFMNPN